MTVFTLLKQKMLLKEKINSSQSTGIGGVCSAQTKDHILPCDVESHPTEVLR